MWFKQTQHCTRCVGTPDTATYITIQQNSHSLLESAIWLDLLMQEATKSPNLWNPQPAAISTALEHPPKHSCSPYIGPSLSPLFCPRWLRFRMASGGQHQPVIWVGWPLSACLAGCGSAPALISAPQNTVTTYHMSHCRPDCKHCTGQRSPGIGLEATFTADARVTCLLAMPPLKPQRGHMVSLNLWYPNWVPFLPWVNPLKGYSVPLWLSSSS